MKVNLEANMKLPISLKRGKEHKATCTESSFKTNVVDYAYENKLGASKKSEVPHFSQR